MRYTPLKFAHNCPSTFLCTGLAAQTTQKQKSCTTKSPLMRTGYSDWEEGAKNRVASSSPASSSWPLCTIWQTFVSYIYKFIKDKFLLSKNKVERYEMKKKLGFVASPVIQANGRLTFEDDLRSGGLLYFTTQWTSVHTELANSMVNLGEPGGG